MSKIQKFYTRCEAGQIHGRRIDGEGRPIVLLHRTPVNSSGFEVLMHFLAKDGCEVIALDSPGFGESFRPAGHPSAADYGRWFLHALEAMGVDSFDLAAHHTGTHFACEMAALAPHRVQSLTLSGILLAPEDERRKMRADIGNADPVDARGEYIGKAYRLMDSLFLDPAPDLVHLETLGALQSGAARDQAFDAIFNQDLEALLDRIVADNHVKIQAVQAADDPLTLNGMLQRFRQRYPAIPVHIIGPAFLATPERQPGAFGRAILNFCKDRDVMTDNRSYRLRSRDGGYDLVRSDSEIPSPGPGEVLVKVHAVSLNRRDLGIRDLSYPVNGADDFLPLSDAAGEIVSIGSGVTGWAVGDRVASTFFQHFANGRLNLPAVMSALGSGGAGVFADYVILQAGGLVPIPQGWSFAEAACLPCAGVTAWSALKTLGGLQEGDRVLILGTGGVALFALQIAVASGARVIMLSSSEEKIARVRKMGAHDCINYRDVPDWAEAVRELTKGAGVDHVVELGGAGTLSKSVATLGLNGHLALIGALDGFGGSLDTLPLIFAALRVSAVMVGSRADHVALSEFMAAHDLKPIIDSEFDFSEAEEAYAAAGSGAFGKVVVHMRERP